MQIRQATVDDIPAIMDLGQRFGHLMFYQKEMSLLLPHLKDIIVAERNPGEGVEPWLGLPKVVGYYHYLPIRGPNDIELLKCYKQLSGSMIWDAISKASKYSPLLCVCMQGASHREVFSKFIKYLQDRFPEIWCWCSVKSKRPETYTDLGFTFNESEQRTFFNVHKGDMSTYRLGRWIKK